MHVILCIVKKCEDVFQRCVTDQFCFLLNGDRLGEMLKFMRNIDIQVFLRFGSFLQVFGQFKKSLILELHKSVTCSCVPNCFYFAL